MREAAREGAGRRSGAGSGQDRRRWKPHTGHVATPRSGSSSRKLAQPLVEQKKRPAVATRRRRRRIEAARELRLVVVARVSTIDGSLLGLPGHPGPRHRPGARSALTIRDGDRSGDGFVRRSAREPLLSFDLRRRLVYRCVECGWGRANCQQAGGHATMGIVARSSSIGRFSPGRAPRSGPVRRPAQDGGGAGRARAWTLRPGSRPGSGHVRRPSPRAVDRCACATAG